jgi:serralysin
MIMSGTGNPTFLVGATGDQYIDGLIHSRAWSGGSINYAFSTSSAPYNYAGTGLTDLPANFATISAAQEAAAHFALNAEVGPTADAGFAIEGFTNLTITSLGNSNSTTAQIRFGETSSAIVGTARVADFPGSTETTPVADDGDVWFGTDYNYRSPQAGNYAWHTMLHEIGHAVGLKHGQATYNFGAVPADRDAMEYTIMTYRSYVNDPISGGYSNETWGYAQTYMMLDIAALQHMYGADYTTNSGNTVYKWDPNSGNTLVDGAIAINPGANRIFATIWDGGGIDTYDLSSYTTSVTINLTPGESSKFSDVQTANLGDGNFASGNIYNALLFQGNTGSLIENAYGGSGDDTISGNQADNTLKGLGGNDNLYGGDGGDSLFGGDGNDFIKGGGGGDSLFGDANDDTLKGGGGADAFYGGSGNDTVDYTLSTAVTVNLGANTGSGGDAAGDTFTDIENLVGTAEGDSLTGNGNANSLYGGDGGDSLYGGAGEDFLYGGDGADLFDGGSGKDNSYGGAGNDFFEHNGGDFGSNVYGGADNDTLSMVGWTNSSIAFNINLATQTYQFLPNNFGLDGTYDLVDVENAWGSDFNDTITGDVNANVLKGIGGNDTIIGGGGIDQIYGGAGNDTITDSGNNEVYGDDGDDTIINTFVASGTYDGGDGSDTIDLSFDNYNANIDLSGVSFTNFGAVFSNFENAIGTAGDDTITGKVGVFNTLNGSLGSDTIIDNDGTDDNLDGGAGTDLLLSDLNYVDDATFNMLTGLGTFSGGTFVHLANFENITVGGGANIIGDNGNNILIASDLVALGSNRFEGNGGDDALTTNAGNDLLYGGAGNDQLYAGDGDDYLNGGANNDIINGGAGSDTVDYTAAASALSINLTLAVQTSTGGLGTDTLSGIENILGGAFADTLVGNADVNSIYGGASNDNISGGDGNDAWLGGDAGADSIYGGLGNDRIDGGADNDSWLGGDAGADFITGGLGNDRIDGGDDNDSLYGNDGDDYLTGGNGDEVWIGGDAGVDSLYGGAGNDRIDGGADSDTWLGGDAGNDYITGGLGNDRIDGGDGNDSAYGEGGNDYITGGNGDDVWLGGDAGADSVYGGAGNDRIDGGADDDAWLGGDGGIDFITGGAGNDRIDGGADNDSWLGGDAGIDYITGGAGNDRIDGGADNDSWLGGDAGNDNITGGAGNDRIDGGADNDLLFGQAGADYITGGAGDDLIEGGAGNDLLYGGLGADIFDFNPGSESDNVYDFTNDVDTLRFDPAYGFADVAAVLAATTVFGGTTARINLAGGFSVYLVGYLTGGNTIASLGDDILIA